MNVPSASSIIKFCLIAFAASVTLHGSSALAEQEAGTDALKSMPVQEAGRIKPFDTFAREALQLIYGRQAFEAASGLKRPAREVVMTWMIAPQFWDAEQIVQITHQGLKEALNLDRARSRFSPNELFKNDRMPLVLQELAGKRESKEKLGPYYQSAQRLESALGTYQAIKNGTGVHPMPPVPGAPGSLATNGRWTSVSELSGEARDRFMSLAHAFIRALPQSAKGPDAPPDEAGGSLSEKRATLAEAVTAFVDYGHRVNSDAYGDATPIAVEVFYNDLHPFMWAWILYLSAALISAVAWQRQSWMGYRIGFALAAFAFAMHTFGFGLRIYLTHRPPVSNMYESVVWVSWGALLFALIFESVYRRRYAVLAGSIVGVICLIVADMAPVILDESLQPLEPVLRSNYWLMIHVLTITLSYSAFFLAWGLAMLGLGFMLRGDKATSERVRGIVQADYRAIQIGVVLLAAGTILGGVWADKSWGRFWGWDPKETWALIALLGYLAILHARLAGLIQGFGLMASAVISFSLVMMAWYGVNYVLGAGLHTYGFGAGGVQYVGGFVALNFIYVGYVAFVRRARESRQ